MEMRKLAAIALAGLPLVSGVLGPDGRCSLFAFVPYSFSGQSFQRESCDNCLNFGYSHIAAALMAVKHFNNKNPVVVKELAEFSDCPIQLDLSAFDTETHTHAAAKTLVRQPEPPCAVVGPYNDIPSNDLATLSASYEFPMTSHRSYDLRSAIPSVSQFTNQMFPDIITTAESLAVFLDHIGRNYIAVMTGLTIFGSQVREALTTILDNVQDYSGGSQPYLVYRSFSYNAYQSPAKSSVREVHVVLADIIGSGFRTVILNCEIPRLELKGIAKSAVEAGMTNGAYLWVIFGDLDLSMLGKDDDIDELLRGAVWLTPRELSFWNETHPFTLAWHNQTEDEVENLNAVNPIREEDPVFFKANSSFFQDKNPEYGSAWMYDSVISTGIGACVAAEKDGLNFNSRAHVAGIRSSHFEGASGTVRFCALSEHCNYLNLNGARDPYSIDFSVLNIRPDLTYQAIGVVRGHSYKEINQAVYANGMSTPPLPLRVEPEQNYLSENFRVFGFTLFVVALVLSVVTAFWIFFHMENHVVKAAQPYFLYLLCLGSAAEASAIIALLFDEGQGWSQTQLDRACMAVLWLFCLGYIVTYGALFTKLWRINQVLQFSRRTINVRQVAWPSALLTALAVILLSVWTAVDGLTWTREELNEDTGESIGRCDCDSLLAFGVPLVLLMLIPSILTLIMTWKTKDIDDVYCESYWIFVMIVVQLEVIVFALPMVSVLRSVSSTDATFIGLAILIWTFPMSTLLLIIGPKALAFYRAKMGIDENRRRKRGEKIPGGVRVSGLTAEATPPKLSDRTVCHNQLSSTVQRRQTLASVPVTTKLLRQSLPDKESRSGTEQAEGSE